MFSHYRLIEKQTLAHYSGDLELVFIELLKFIKELDELTNISEKWVYFVQNAGSLDYVPDRLKTEQCFQYCQPCGAVGGGTGGTGKTP